ncbi:hypothetical protein Salat_1655800 [Sesamum alatum]|uniref:Uncharacterized protein n=1 Tax=Sesamum alatum TaxID=300844 RepID=A0AAE2CJM5_9LAMI|nr:hypothetical protein Salat_1655800 [Sesamum alatum]
MKLVPKLSPSLFLSTNSNQRFSLPKTLIQKYHEIVELSVDGENVNEDNCGEGGGLEGERGNEGDDSRSRNKKHKGEDEDWNDDWVDGDDLVGKGDEDEASGSIYFGERNDDEDDGVSNYYSNNH